MKITIESTNQIIPELGRVWEGVTDAGHPCKVIVACIGTNTEEAQRQLDEELGTLGNRGPDGVTVFQHMFTVVRD